LLSAQEEFLLALKHHNSLLINAGIKKLITLGMSERDVDFLKKTRKTQQNVAIYAPQSGYVNKLDVIDGAHVMPTTSLMTIVDPSIVWVIADVYEKQASLLKVGHSVQARFNSLPN
jgi:membrane fusion protein, copper/silver efflux system